MNLQQPLFVRRYVVIRKGEYLHQCSTPMATMWTPQRDLAWVFMTRVEAQRRVRLLFGSRVGQIECLRGTSIPAKA